uniref:Ig-like domain-containing protein n=1 Tax=Latimeria chalumnae TaxID=7897 RepID=H3A083_LATCH
AVAVSASVVGTVGTSVVLPCSYPTAAAVSLEDLNIYWQINDSMVVHFFRKKDDNAHQHPKYKNRTKLFYKELVQGDCSLTLFNVNVGDEAKYSAHVILATTSEKHTTEVYLQSSPASYKMPLISRRPISGNIPCGKNATYTCTSSGGYPKPWVLWLINNTEVPTDPNNLQIQQDPTNQLYTVTGFLNANITEESNVSCIFMNNVLGENKTA